MANGVLGLGAGQAASLNSDLIEKLKTAERKSAVAPIEAKIEKMVKEKETFSTIEKKVAELLESIKPFDLFVSGAVTAFEQKSATTSGDSVTFDAADVKALKKGFTSVDIKTLAQKDVYQTNDVTGVQKDQVIGKGDLIVNGQVFKTDNLTYKQLADEINTKEGMSASLEQVGTDSYRLVIKSKESGLDNALLITGDAKSALGLDVTENHKQTAQNMKATVDGVEYNVSSNSLVVDGLKISANKAGISTINVTEDNSQIEAQMKNFVDKYNELVALIETETLGSDSSLNDRSSIKGIVNQIKDKLFGSYGAAGDKSVFNFGIELDKFGGLSIDSKKFNEAVQKDMAGLKDLFVGSAEKKGLGTVLKETLDTMKFVGGVLNSYDAAMKTREKSLNENKEKAEKSLDVKYQQLALQFSSYGALINQMESSFSGLKLMIQQSVAG
ncbi:MAG: flagellar filament capping protein FliD [Aliarcobacter sp.]|nr:flagellar filament capping protein FliD [Aliarcobacter sp.]MBP7225496.1 flagellar filament capping protein FliD [Aliarcobacter sp.]